MNEEVIEPETKPEFTLQDWQEVNKWESHWWGDCTNTFIEEVKQMQIIKYMSLKADVKDAKVGIDIQGKNICDLGGGVVSLLLKCINRGNYCVVVDPILEKAPIWVKERYKASDLFYSESMAELAEFDKKFDEVWLYNVLQHVQNPLEVLDTVKRLGNAVRIFEWLNTPPHDGHPHTITKEMIDESLGINLQVSEDMPEFMSGYRIAGHGYYKL